MSVETATRADLGAARATLLIGLGGRALIDRLVAETGERSFTIPCSQLEQDAGVNPSFLEANDYARSNPKSRPFLIVDEVDVAVPRAVHTAFWMHTYRRADEAVLQNNLRLVYLAEVYPEAISPDNISLLGIHVRHIEDESRSTTLRFSDVSSRHTES